MSQAKVDFPYIQVDVKKTNLEFHHHQGDKENRKHNDILKKTSYFPSHLGGDGIPSWFSWHQLGCRENQLWLGSFSFRLLSRDYRFWFISYNPFIIQNLCLYVVNGSCLSNIEIRSLSDQGLGEGLNTSSRSQDKASCWLFLDVIVNESSVIFQFRHDVLMTPVLVLTERITIHLKNQGEPLDLKLFKFFPIFKSYLVYCTKIN